MLTYAYSRILPLERKLKYQNCLFVFSQLKHELPVHFDNFCSIFGSRHDYNTKASRLEITRTRTVTYGTYCIKNLIAKHWKEIIPKLSVKTNAILKNGLKKHIKYFPPL